jgi:hypothetical protein
VRAGRSRGGKALLFCERPQERWWWLDGWLAMEGPRALSYGGGDGAVAGLWIEVTHGNGGGSRGAAGPANAKSEAARAINAQSAILLRIFSLALLSCNCKCQSASPPSTGCFAASMNLSA